MMYGIPLVDVQSLTTRYARSALPAAPVLEQRKRRSVVVAKLAVRR